MEAELKRIEALEKEVQLLKLLVLKMNSEVNSEVIFEAQDGRKVTMDQVKEYLKRFDIKHIRQILTVVTEKYNDHYEYLPFALSKWLEEPVSGIKSENETLLKYGLPPVAEQERLFPGKAVIGKDAMSRAELKNVFKSSEEQIAQWKKEQAESEIPENGPKQPGNESEKTETSQKFTNKKGKSFRDVYRSNLKSKGLDPDKLGV